VHLLKKHLSEVTFEDVVKFCETQIPEGVQLDYKKEIPNSLKKHFAAFSNKKDGLIIIGVEEDPNTGLPVSWDGIDPGKWEEQLHQIAANVDPLPTYKIKTTNEVNSKVFVLIKIAEGGNPPYYVLNDPNLYVRTGSISKLIDKASPEEAKSLIAKKTKAIEARRANIEFAKRVFESALENADRERQTRYDEAVAKYIKDNLDDKVLKNFKAPTQKEKLGYKTSVFTLELQPMYPDGILIDPKELDDIKNQMRVYKSSREFPPLNMNPVQNGLYDFNWSYLGAIYFDLMLGNGLIYRKLDFRAPYNNNVDIPAIWISSFASVIITTLLFARKLYSHVGYFGELSGKFHVADVKNINVVPIRLPGGLYWDDFRQCLLDEYPWELAKFNTEILADNEKLSKYLSNKLKEVYWSLGYRDLKDDFIEKYFEKEKFFVK